MTRIKVLSDMVNPVLYIQAGSIIERPDAEARDMVRAGVAEYIEDEPPHKEESHHHAKPAKKTKGSH